VHQQHAGGHAPRLSVGGWGGAVAPDSSLVERDQVVAERIGEPDSSDCPRPAPVQRHRS